MEYHCMDIELYGNILYTHSDIHIQWQRGHEIYREDTRREMWEKETNCLCIGQDTEDLIFGDNNEIITYKEYRYLRSIFNWEGLRNR